MQTTVPVLHADEAMLVIDKPAGLLAVPGRGPDKADCAAARVQAHYPDALVVHRLDMATSGLMVFGRGAEAQRALSVAFAEREVDKRYVALVHGEVPGEHGTIELPLRVDWPNRPRQQVDWVQGKPSATRWRVLARGPETTRLELEPVTGRSHQLRVHLLAIGHPIVGDALYHPTPDAGMAPRLMLHACRLTLVHPFDRRVLTFESPVPF